VYYCFYLFFFFIIIFFKHSFHSGEQRLVTFIQKVINDHQQEEDIVSSLIFQYLNLSLFFSFALSISKVGKEI